MADTKPGLVSDGAALEIITALVTASTTLLPLVEKLVADLKNPSQDPLAPRVAKDTQATMDALETPIGGQ